MLILQGQYIVPSSLSMHSFTFHFFWVCISCTWLLHTWNWCLFGFSSSLHSCRFTPKNLHQRPTVALLCGPHVQGAQGISCGRHLGNHEVEVILFLPNFVKMLDAVTSEVTLFNKTGGKQVSSIKGEDVILLVSGFAVCVTVALHLTVQFTLQCLIPSLCPGRPPRHPGRPHHQLPRLPREHIPDGSALVPGRCRLGQPESSAGAQLGPSRQRTAPGGGSQVVPVALPPPLPGWGGRQSVPVWHRCPPPSVPGSGNQVPFSVWLQICHPSAFSVAGLDDGGKKTTPPLLHHRFFWDLLCFSVISAAHQLIH